MATREPVKAAKGLFAHVQGNNLRSIALFLWFAVLLELLYVATSLILISLGSPIEKMLEAVLDGVDASSSKMVTTSLHAPKQPPPGFPMDFPQSFGEIFTRFVERDALLGSIALVILGLAALYVLVGIVINSRLTRRQLAAIRVRRQDEPRLYALVEQLTIARGLPMPQIEVIESDGCNAYASGWSPASSTIGVTRGLLNVLDDQELESVLAHEVAHIENRDNRLMTVAKLCANVVISQSRKTVEYMREQPLQTALGFVAVMFIASWQGVLLGYALIVLAYMMAHAVKYLISQKREFIADARAIEMVKQPTALMTALHKIGQNDKIDGLDPALQAMMISNLSGVDQWTHPSIPNRIAAISAVTGVTLQDALARSSGTARERWAGAREYFSPQQRPAVQQQKFGNRLSDRAAARRSTVDPSEKASVPHDAQPTPHGAPQTLRSEMFGDQSYGAKEQWSESEIRTEQLIRKAGKVVQTTRFAAKVTEDGFMVFIRVLALIPLVMFCLFALYSLPIWLSAVLLFAGHSLWNRASRDA